jgi:hypothetical protein
LSHANTKGKGINSEGWVGNQVSRQLGLRKEKRSEILEEISKNPFGEIKTINSMLMTKYQVTT